MSLSRAVDVAGSGGEVPAELLSEAFREICAGKADELQIAALLVALRTRGETVGEMVAVARALANQPKLVLADEPTGNLDPRNAREAIKLIREICRETGAALLIVSHDQSVLEQFDDCADLAEINRAMQGMAP